MSNATDPFASLRARRAVTYGSGENAFTIDFTRLPVLAVTFVGTVDDDAFRRYLDELAGVVKTRSPYVLLADATRADRPTARQRTLQAELLREHSDLFGRYCKGAAFVIDSPVVRGALTAIMWIQSLPYEHTVVATREEAERWLRGRVE